MSNQTPFEQAGYTKDDTFVIIKDEIYLKQGTKLVLHLDGGEVFNPSLGQLCKLID